MKYVFYFLQSRNCVKEETLRESLNVLLLGCSLVKPWNESIIELFIMSHSNMPGMGHSRRELFSPSKGWVVLICFINHHILQTFKYWKTSTFNFQLFFSWNFKTTTSTLLYHTFNTLLPTSNVLSYTLFNQKCVRWFRADGWHPICVWWRPGPEGRADNVVESNRGPTSVWTSQELTVY